MLSISEIKRFIDDDATSDKKRFAKIGQRYYEADHDILKYRIFYYDADGVLKEDTIRANNKICHPFFTELSDQLVSYMLSAKENPIRAKEKAEGLQDYLDEYFDEDFWAEISDLISGAYNKGYEYIYAKKNADDRLAFECADSIGVIEVRAKDTDDHCEYVIYWYIDRIEKGKKKIKRIQVWDKDQTYFYVQSGDTGKIELDDSEELNPRPHVVFTDEKSGKRMGESLGFIPFWRLDNNKKQFSGIKPIKGIIDDYDMMQCGLSNNLQDFDTPVYMVAGFDGHSDDELGELFQNVKTKKIVGVEQGGGIDIKTIDVPYQARKTKADEDEKNIYRFGMGLNTLGLKDTASTTNLAIQAAYSLLEMKAHKLETRLKSLLKNIIKVVLDEINAANDTDYRPADVTFNFERNIMVNEGENATIALTKAQTRQVEVTTILNVAAQVGDEQTLKAICDVMDWPYDDIKAAVDKLKEEQSTLAAMQSLEGVAVDDDTLEGGAVEGAE